MLYTRTSTYRNEVNFFASTLQNQKSPSKKCANAYTFGFNGMENEYEISGNDNSLDFGARIYDPCIGRWWGVDNKASLHPDISPYTFAFNSPLIFIDPDGNNPIEAGKELYVNISFFAYDFIGTDKPSASHLATINDYELYHRMDIWNMFLVLSGTFYAVPKGLTDIFEGIAADYGLKNLSDHVDALLDGTFSDSYALDNFEYGPDYDPNRDDNLPNKYIHRLVQNMGYGFEAMVTYKEAYNLTYSKDKVGDLVVEKKISASYIYNAPIMNTEYGKEGSDFKEFMYVQTETKISYNDDGTNTTTYTTIGLNPRNNTKTCSTCD